MDKEGIIVGCGIPFSSHLYFEAAVTSRFPLPRRRDGEGATIYPQAKNEQLMRCAARASERARGEGAAARGVGEKKMALQQ